MVAQGHELVRRIQAGAAVQLGVDVVAAGDHQAVRTPDHVMQVGVVVGRVERELISSGRQMPEDDDRDALERLVDLFEAMLLYLVIR